MIEVKVPEAGESVSEVMIAEWLKNDGDYVEMDEILCELESDKATLELPAESSGQLEILVEAGEEVDVGQVIAKIDTEAEKPEGEEKEEEEETQEKEEQETEKETAKEAPQKEREKAPAAQKAEEVEKTVTKEKPEKESQEEATYASPAASKLIRENDIDTSQIQGTGKDGRITKQDVQQFLKEKPEDGKTPQTQPPGDISGIPGQPEEPFSRETDRQRMSTLRKTVARHLVSAKNDTAMLTTFNEVDMTRVMEIRKQHKEDFQEKHGVRLGLMSFFTKACCIALQEYPHVNAQIDDDEIVYHDFCDIGMAVATPKGLVVPVIRNAESLTMAEIEETVQDYAQRGRENKITMDEMEGGTFTITNGGVFGSLMSTPIINAPQSAILGMHKIEERPMAIDGEVEVRPMMYVALSYDHRIIDGQISVKFLVKVKELLENPEQLFLGQDPVKLLLNL